MATANIIYKYAQSSCDCYDCNQKTYPKESGYPTNFSVRDCCVNDKFKCYNTDIFKKQQEPNNKEGYKWINKPDGGLQVSKGFESVTCPENCACPGTTYISHDPRLLDVRRNILTKLDRPSYTGEVNLKDIYNKDLNGYGRSFYADYADIDTGQIGYYYDRSIEDAFYKPVYDIPSKVTGVLYQDPMSNMKPQYIKEPIMKSDPINGPEDNFACLSFVSDTNGFREDIIARQQLKNNQQKYSARWTGNLL
jgi:hypothetical protein